MNPNRFTPGKVCATVLLLMCGCTPEPVYNGRPLSYWKQELKSNEMIARYRAAGVLREVGPKARIAIPELIDCLHDEEVHVVVASAHALGSIGPDAREAIPELEKLTSDPNPDVREAAGYALKKIKSGPSS
jgi:HEAT repeat protein